MLMHDLMLPFYGTSSVKLTNHPLEMSDLLGLL